jgi:hypothetical protein
MVVLVVVVILAAILFPNIMTGEGRRKPVLRANCIRNLHEIGLGFRIWSGDHMDRYPTQVLTNWDGSLVFPNATNAYRYFAAMSNELNTPVVLACPADKARSPATSWASLSNSNLSYFIALDADEMQPAMLLAGDRNLTNGAPLTNGILTLNTNRSIAWTRGLHWPNGNVALADGSVQQISSSRLRGAATDGGTNFVRLLMP